MVERAWARWWAAIGAAACIASAAAADVRAPDEVAYIIRPGDTLIGIAKEHLADPARWSDVKKRNRVLNDRRLKPGATLHIPVEWLRQSPGQAIVMRADGDVRVDGQQARTGDRLDQGVHIETGERGSIAIRFSDGAITVVQPRTAVRLEGLRSLPSLGANRTRLRLQGGRIENSVTPQRRPGALFEVETPAAVAGVRGTKYRVADAAGNALTEVIEGEVVVNGAQRDRAGVDVKAGFGVRVSAGGEVPRPVALLAAPDLAGLPVLQERPLVRLRVPALAGAVRHRAQVSPDASFETVLQETVFEGREMRFAGLPDGRYVVRVRGIDASGLEGRDAVHAFRLKARPEPPFPSAPPDRGKIRGTQVQFRWAAVAEADRYLLQVAADPAFATLIVDASDIAATTHTPPVAFEPGAYHWRIASIRSDGDRGPWSDPAAFNVLPAPAAPEPPAIDEDHLTLRWPAEPGQRFRFQMATDSRFGEMHVERRLDEPTITLPRPQAGVYFVRVQATDPDGFVGPYTTAQRIEVPEPPPSPWIFLLLLPLLLTL